MALSQHAIDKCGSDSAPKFRTTSHLDFLRGEAGMAEVPVIFDDGNIRGETVPALKAFMDVAGEDSRLITRYASANFEQYQPRILCIRLSAWVSLIGLAYI